MKRLGVVSIALLLTVSVGSQASRAEGWSLLHPFSSGTKTVAKPTRPAQKPAKKEASVAEKAASGTKKFFGGVGNALSLKKPEAKKPSSPSGSQSYASAPPKSKQTKQSSWWSPFHKEPPKPQSLSDFVGMKRPE